MPAKFMYATSAYATISTQFQVLKIDTRHLYMYNANKLSIIEIYYIYAS
jgi:hypothetical protein